MKSVLEKPYGTLKKKVKNLKMDLESDTVRLEKSEKCPQKALRSFKKKLYSMSQKALRPFFKKSEQLKNVLKVRFNPIGICIFGIFIINK